MADALISVAGVTVAPGVRSNTVRWTVNIASCLPYLQLAVFEVWSATSNNRALATKVGEATDLSFTQQGLLIGVARYYWVRAKDASGQYSDFFPLSATSGVAGVPTSTGTNSVGEDELAPDSVGSVHLKAASVTAGKISVTSLSAISATLGSVAVHGDLIVGGTIKGSRLISTGTDRILTDHINNNQVTVAGSDVTDSPVNITNTNPSLPSAWRDIASFSMTPNGGKVVLIASSTAYARSLAGGSDGGVQFAIYKNNSQLTMREVAYDVGEWEREPVTLMAEDTSPGTSSVTYALRARGVLNLVGGTGNCNNATARRASGIVGFNLKK